MTYIEELFTVIPSYPGQNICLIFDKQVDISLSLIKFCIENEINLYIKDIEGNLLSLNRPPFVKVEKFSFKDKRYNLHSVLYDFIFFSYSLEDDPDILKKIYRVTKNAGNIFIFTKSDPDELIKLLEKINFVAINEIDTFRKTHIISAKKMHGWMKV